MKLKEVQEVLGAGLAWRPNRYDYDTLDIHSCHASDLLSDVITFQGKGSLLLTGLTNPQVIRTATLLDFVAVAITRGKHPLPETVTLAEQGGVILLLTPFSMFEACGRLYEKCLRSPSQHQGTAS
jgi:hypothetical protein